MKPIVFASKFAINFVALIAIFVIFLSLIDHLTIALLVSLIIVYGVEYVNKKIRQVVLS